MFKFRLEAENTFFILAPRWADLGTAWQVSLLALLFVLPLVMILWLYRYELRLVSVGAACGLLFLRLLILSVIWVAIALQPQVAEVHVKETKGRVRIAVDLSASMDVIDHQRTLEEKHGLARALQSPEVDRLTRRAIVEKILSPQGLNLLQRLEDRHEVEIVGFHQQSLEMPPAQLLRVLSDDKNTPDLLTTDLRQPLGKVATNSTLPHLGILLFSDGQHNKGAPPYVRADELGRMRVPIFPVVIGSREPPNDLMILDVQAPTKVFKGATISVDVRCKVTNMPAQAMTVEMRIGTKPVQPEHRNIIPHQGQDDVYTVRFQAKMDEPGTHKLAIKATSAEQKEITLANNGALRVVRVADDSDKAKVLLVDGEARWEYHYLANALMRDSTIGLERVVFNQPRLGLLKDDQMEQAGLAKSKLPEPKAERPDYDPLSAFDCIVLGDVSPEQLPVADRKRLERFVAERGGTLILIAGKRYLPLEFAKEDKKGDDPLVKMLPISEARAVNTEKGFTLTVTAEGKLRPFLQLDPDTPANTWPELPKHYWGVVGKRKPAASVLLTPMFDKTERPKDDADTGILLQQNYGFGRVMFVGIDSTWRWRFRVGDVYHHRFWGQVARWAAAEKLLPAGNRWVRFGPLEPVYSDGDTADLAVRLSDLLPPLKDIGAARVKLHRRNADDTETLLPPFQLEKHPRQPNLFVAKAANLTHGTYRMEVDIPEYRAKLAEPSDEKTPVAGRDLFEVMPGEQPELLDLSTNWTVMQSLAERTDGKLYTPENVDEILDRLARRVESTDEPTRSKPWEDVPWVWWLLGTLLGLLTLEWVWRKRLDLP